MKYITIISILLLSFSGLSQTQYQNGMQKALGLWGENKPWDAVNMFERIVAAETDEWLPAYYASMVTILNSFGEKDEAKLKAQLDRALVYLNEAKAISKDNPELLILECLWYTAWVAYDGAAYGMKYGAKVSTLYEEALQLAPNNPRVLLNKSEWGIGSAKFFGQSTDPFCADIQRSIDLFPDFKPEEEFYPTYGLERAKVVLEENCK